MRKRFQIGHVFKRGKKCKVWIGCYRETVMDGGEFKRVQRQKVLGRCDGMTKGQAEQALTVILQPINGGKHRPEQHMTFGQFVERWKSEILIHYRESTRQFYEATIDRWILPYFKNWKLGEVSTPDLQVFVNCFRDYSRSTLKQVRATASVLMTTAVDWQWIERNPLTGVKLPPGKAVKRAPVLLPEQVKALADRLKEPYRTMVVIATSMGLRESEVLALRWDDVDMLAQTVTVRRRLYRGKLGEPKTEQSARVIPYGSAVKDALERLRLSDRPKSEFLFVTKPGNLFTAQQVTAKVFRPLAEKLNLPKFTWRSFRRSAETAMHLGDVPLKVQQQILGHANPNMTLLYAEPGLDAKRKAIEGLSGLLFADVGNSHATQ